MFNLLRLEFIIFSVLLALCIPGFVVWRYHKLAPVEKIDSGRNLLKHLSNRIFCDLEDLYPEIRMLSCREDTFTIDDVGASILIETNTPVRFRLTYTYSDDDYQLWEV